MKKLVVLLLTILIVFNLNSCKIKDDVSSLNQTEKNFYYSKNTTVTEASTRILYSLDGQL